MATRGFYSDEDLEFMPDVHAAALRRGRRFAYILSIMAVAFFVIFGFWANYAVLDEVTRGQAKIVPSSKTQIIQNLEGGILSEILVREGDIVERGDILVRIDNTTATANYRDARGQYLTLLATVARLEAELDGSEPKMPEEVLKDGPDQARGQLELYKARTQQLEAQTGVLKAQAQQRKGEIAEMSSKLRQLRNSLELARQELAITLPLVQSGVMPRLDLIRIERQVTDLEGEIRTIQATIPRLQSAATEAERRIQEMVATTKTEVSTQLNEARAELKSVREALFAGQDRVTRTDVRSPVRGTVKQLKLNTVGGVIRPGEDILEIVPLDDSLLVEADIRPADVAFLRPGQEAMVKITAYDFSIYGGLKAELEQISADTIKNEKDESFYRVYLRTNQNTLLH
ncbi:MAG: HlyD family type I secretion periplasmic adaptor subunit [Kiloniellales bacterium]